MWAKHAYFIFRRIIMSRKLIFRVLAGFMFIVFSIALSSMSSAAEGWTIKADMPTARTSLSTSVVNGKVYAISGLSPEDAVDFTQEPARLGSGQVRSIAFSPDGTILAAWHDAEGAVLLWDVEAQKQVGALKKDLGTIYSIAFSPDGKLLALGGQGNTIRLWDVAGQNQVGVMQSPTRRTVHSVAFSPDGKTLASSGTNWGENVVRLWDVQTQQQVGELKGHTQEGVYSVAFSPDGRLLFSGGWRGDEAIRVWDVQTQKQVGELIGHLDITDALAFSPDDIILASAGGGDDMAVYLWDVQAQKQVGVLGGHTAHVGSVAFSPDGKLLASTVFWDDTVHFWDVKGQKHVGVLKGHDASDMGWFDQVAFSPDGKWLACGSENGVELWELNLPGPISRAYAFGPRPFDDSLHTDTLVNLEWRAGDFALSHDVYIGENFDDVNAGAEGTFVGNQALTSLIVGLPGFAIPDGLVPGTTYYWRIDEVNDTEPNSPWKGPVWSFTIPTTKAHDPKPSDGVKYVDPYVELNWTAGFGAKLHIVYFGENFDEVNDATGGFPQGATTYTPGTLANDTVYYWRVDESTAGRGSETHKGDVWSFRTLPNVPITDPNLTCWWTLDEGMGTTAVDWSGHGNHGILFGPEWAIPGLLGDAALNFGLGDYVAIQNLSYNSTGNTGVTVCAWIRTSSAANHQYIASFDRDEYWRLEIFGKRGPGRVGWCVMTSSGQVDYVSSTRVHDGLWHHVTGVFDNGRLTIYIDGVAEPSATGGSTFGSGTTRFGFIGANSEASSFNGSTDGVYPVSGEIDELRIYDKALTVEEILQVMRGDPLLAWDPKPRNGSTPNIRDATPLSWSPGDNASEHDVYFGTDRDTVADTGESDTTGIYRGRQGVSSYNPPEGVEWGGGPYYWRIDEYNTDGTISKGSVWSFTVADYLLVDDFEDYDAGNNEIWWAWIDGIGYASHPTLPAHPGNGTGSMVGDETTGSYMEETIFHGGGKSMPVFYDNNQQGKLKYSEVEMTLTYPRDWTENGVNTLTIWFRGDSANAAETLYVALNSSAVVNHDNPDAAQITTWTQWNIDLQAFADQGVNLANVNTIAIGLGNKKNPQAGGSGTMYFDDIRLYRPAPEPAP
jgi:WD40 repeat protein